MMFVSKLHIELDYLEDETRPCFVCMTTLFVLFALVFAIGHIVTNCGYSNPIERRKKIK